LEGGGGSEALGGDLVKKESAHEFRNLILLMVLPSRDFLIS
jgi:hypothetical protein